MKTVERQTKAQNRQIRALVSRPTLFSLSQTEPMPME